MYHFETIDPKTKKNLIFEDKDFKTILKTVLQHENNKFKNDDDAEIVIEDSVGNILQTVTEKILKHILGIQSIRKTAKLEKSIETFNKLKMNEVATVTFKNKCHSGIITIWEKEDDESIQNSDDELDDELEQAILEGNASESDIESVHIKVSNGVVLENTKLKEENTKLKEQVQILKNIVSKYRELALKINDDSKVFKFI